MHFVKLGYDLVCNNFYTVCKLQIARVHTEAQI